MCVLQPSSADVEESGPHSIFYLAGSTASLTAVRERWLTLRTLPPISRLLPRRDSVGGGPYIHMRLAGGPAPPHIPYMAYLQANDSPSSAPHTATLPSAHRAIRYSSVRIHVLAMRIPALAHQEKPPVLISNKLELMPLIKGARRSCVELAVKIKVLLTTRPIWALESLKTWE